MVEFINSLTGTRMSVAPERQEEYLAAGHRLVQAEGAQPAGETGAPQAPKRQTAAQKKSAAGKQ